MASKGSQAKRKAARDLAKRNRKGANYLRCGPKEGHAGRRQKRSGYGTHRSRVSKGDIKLERPSAKTRRLRRTVRRGKPVYAKFPLRLLRQRLKLSSKQIHERRVAMRQQCGAAPEVAQT